MTYGNIGKTGERFLHFLLDDGAAAAYSSGMDEPMSLDAALRAARGAADHTQAEAADEIGCTVGQLVQWEAGRSVPQATPQRRAVCGYLMAHLPEIVSRVVECRA